MRLRRVETVHTQTPSLPFCSVIICAFLAALSAFRPIHPCGSRAASLRVRRSSRGLQQSLARRFAVETAIQTSSSDCNAIWNNLRRHSAFSLSLLPGGKIASKRGNAPTGKERGVTVRPSFIGRIWYHNSVQRAVQIRSHVASPRHDDHSPYV